MQRSFPSFDLLRESDRVGWRSLHDTDPLFGDSAGLTIPIVGPDPYIGSPSVSVPTGVPLWLRIRLRAEAAGLGQVFYWTPGGGRGSTEEESVRFPVKGGQEVELRYPLPARSEPQIQFRFDPPGDAGQKATLIYLGLEARTELPEPKWPKPPRRPVTGAMLRSGDCVLVLGATVGTWSLSVRGAEVARGSDAPLLCWQAKPDGRLEWMDWRGRRWQFQRWGQGFRMWCSARDRGGANWTWAQEVRPAGRTSGFHCESTLTVDRPRWLAWWPACVAHSNSNRKDQAVLCGVEYLDTPDTSSSEADLRGPQSQRQIPDPHTPTIPLMAFASGGNWFSLDWRRSADTAPLFDVPDRRFGTGTGLLGVVGPGGSRIPGRLLPSEAKRMGPGAPLRSEVTIRGGAGSKDIVPALQAWVAENGLPKVPLAPDGARLAAIGWLDSIIGSEAGYRHAWPGTFEPQRAPDAVVLQQWLVHRVDASTAQRLRASSAALAKLVAVSDSGGIGHVSTLAPVLVRRGTREWREFAVTKARETLTRFISDGTVPWQRPPGSLDYASTHFAKDANGWTALPLATVLETASRTGDPELRQRGLALLDQLDRRYRNTVPRGAQTWEIPLHTPDILASAHLVKAFAIGYALSGERCWLDAAKRWAWTGVAFTYLTDPAGGAVGVYATTPVLGATQWVAPNWIGLPVQWCGLVYADALLDLHGLDPNPIWRQLAEGIVASAWIQTHPAAGTGSPMSAVRRQGLLPDSWNLLAEVRNDAAINPATAQVPWSRLVGDPVAEWRMLSPGGWQVHAPGRIEVLGPREFRVVGWPEHPYEILLSKSSAKEFSIQREGESAQLAISSGPGWAVCEAVGNVRVTIKET